MKNEIYVACIRHKPNQLYRLEVNLEGKRVALLEGAEEELLPIYEDIVKYWKKHFIPSYNMKIVPYDDEHLMRGHKYLFFIKEEDGATDSKD